jgi:tRNA-uridine 2-sulfurtransferase
MHKRILVAMSGGVDSSVAAALLLRQGMEVEGITMKLTSGLCCDIGSAQAVCERLGIPHQTIDMQTDFTHEIVQNFINEYQCGRTPNPCIRCNNIVKFQLLLQYARSKEFDALATGHYARIEHDPASGVSRLKKGADVGKDQSYFLYQLSQEQMLHILFPVGEMRKTDVRTLARQCGLPAAERPESQEICFVPDNNYRAFLVEHAPRTRLPGDLVLGDGTVVGKHDGIAFFTIGQRRKLGYAAGERLYVIRIEPDTQRVVLGKKTDLLSSETTLSNIHFIPLDTLDASTKVMVKIRYRSPLVSAVIHPMQSGRVRVVFQKPVSGLCPGQSAVFYDGDTILGGGIIER